MTAKYTYHDELYEQRFKQGIKSWDRTPDIVLHTQNAFRALLEKASPSPSSKILEIGCGAGQVTEIIAEFTRDITAIDVSKLAVEEAKSRLTGDAFEFICDDFLKCPQLPERGFDVVVDCHAYNCIVGEDRQTFLSKAHSLLIPGGSLILRTMCGVIPLQFQENESTKIDRAAGTISIRGHDGEFFLYRHMESLETILDRIKVSGFQITFSDVFSETQGTLSQDILAVIAVKI